MGDQWEVMFSMHVFKFILPFYLKLLLSRALSLVGPFSQFATVFGSRFQNIHEPLCSLSPSYVSMGYLDIFLLNFLEYFRSFSQYFKVSNDSINGFVIFSEIRKWHSICCVSYGIIILYVLFICFLMVRGVTISTLISRILSR